METATGRQTQRSCPGHVLPIVYRYNLFLFFSILKVELFFSQIATESATTQLGGANKWVLKLSMKQWVALNTRKYAAWQFRFVHKTQWVSESVCVCVCSLSSSVLQGFTCVGVRTIGIVQVKKLVRACRRKGRNKVVLVETQVREFRARLKQGVQFMLNVSSLSFLFPSPTVDLHVQLH